MQSEFCDVSSNTKIIIPENCDYLSSSGLVVGSKDVQYMPKKLCSKRGTSGPCPTIEEKYHNALVHINKQRGVSSSMRLSSLSALTVTGPMGSNNPLAKYNGQNWNQSSDRAVPHIGPKGGKGVDVKHNSYARFLARKKGATIRLSGYESANPTIIGNNNKNSGNNGVPPNGVCLPLCEVSE